jgi:hypothetical protein
MRIVSMDYCSVKIEDDERRVREVFLQGDGKWQCLACLRYRCVHVQFVKAQKPVLPPRPPSQGDGPEILTY